MTLVSDQLTLLLKICAGTVHALPFVYDFEMERRMQRILRERTTLVIPQSLIRDLLIVGSAYSATGDSRVAVIILTMHHVARAFAIFDLFDDRAPDDDDARSLEVSESVDAQQG